MVSGIDDTRVYPKPHYDGIPIDIKPGDAPYPIGPFHAAGLLDGGKEPPFFKSYRTPTRDERKLHELLACAQATLDKLERTTTKVKLPMYDTSDVTPAFKEMVNRVLECTSDAAANNIVREASKLIGLVLAPQAVCYFDQSLDESLARNSRALDLAILRGYIAALKSKLSEIATRHGASRPGR